MTNPARPDKNGVEVVPVLPEKSELVADDVDFRKGKECIQPGAGQDEGERCDAGVQDSPAARKFGLRPINFRFREKHDFRVGACNGRILAPERE